MVTFWCFFLKSWWMLDVGLFNFTESHIVKMLKICWLFPIQRCKMQICIQNMYFSLLLWNRCYLLSTRLFRHFFYCSTLKRLFFESLHDKVSMYVFKTRTYTKIAYSENAISVRGHSTTKYVDRIMQFYGPPPPSRVDCFYMLSVDKNRHFLTPLPSCPRM